MKNTSFSLYIFCANSCKSFELFKTFSAFSGKDNNSFFNSFIFSLDMLSNISAKYNAIIFNKTT